jgi:hypothetical protein
MVSVVMDSYDKRRLKKLGKNILEKRSEEIRALLAQTNPAPFASEEYLQNEITIRKKEQALRTNDRVLSGAEIRQEFIVRPIDFELHNVYLPIPDQYWECRSCGDFVPAWTNSILICACRNIHLVHLNDFQNQIMVQDQGQIRLVRLMGKATRSKNWWHFWK